MINTEDYTDQLRFTRDYARVEADGDAVMVDAAEWDTDRNLYRKVTLRLSASEAEMVALSLIQASLSGRATKP